MKWHSDNKDRKPIITSPMQSTWLQLDCLRRIFGGRCLHRKTLNNTSMPLPTLFHQYFPLSFQPTDEHTRLRHAVCWRWPWWPWRTPWRKKAAAEGGRWGRGIEQWRAISRCRSLVESCDRVWEEFFGACPLLRNLWLFHTYIYMHIYIHHQDKSYKFLIGQGLHNFT